MFGDVMRRTRTTTAKQIAVVLDKVEKQLGTGDFKATVADYIRLLQIQKEFETTKPRNIEVTWVESLKETKSDNE